VNNTGGGCTSTTNVALNKSASQSSTITANGITGSAFKAVDGNTNGTFFTGDNNTSSVSATQNEFQAYCVIFNQLGQQQFVRDYSSIPTNPVEVNVSKFVPGIYTISIKVDNQRRFAKQFVVVDK